MTDIHNIDSNGLFDRMKQLGITFRNYRHPPLHTVEESQALRGDLPGGHIKNLFLRDKKRHFYLLTVSEDRDVDLKWLRRQMGAQGTLSFGSAEALEGLLGVRPGAVTPLSVVNDNEGKVAAFLDKSLLEIDPIHAHPLRNDMTLALSGADLIRFMSETGHEPQLINFNQQD